METGAQAFPGRRVWRATFVILVLVGTNPYSFERMVGAVDELAEKKKWDVFIQLGNTAYEPSHCKYERFVNKDIILEKIQACEFVICHGGFGSMRDALAADKKIIAVPRKPELGECNDYQEELVRELEDLGLVMGVYDIDTLPDAVERLDTFIPDKPGPNRIPDIIQEYLNTVA